MAPPSGTSDRGHYEIERKFLVADESWRPHARSHPMSQGYLFSDRVRSARVRVVDDKAVLGIKGPLTPDGRLEFEYPIPKEDAHLLLQELCQGARIFKVRHLVDFGGHTWEIDEFQDRNQGLIVAEVELGAPEETVEMPPWIGPEVTGEPRFYNTNLSQHPFDEWKMSYQDLLEELEG